MSFSRQQLIIRLKTEPVRSLAFLEALREADIATLGEAIKECIHAAPPLVVNRRRAGILVDMLVQRATQPAVMELTQTPTT